MGIPSILSIRILVCFVSIGDHVCKDVKIICDAIFLIAGVSSLTRPL